MNPAIQSLMDEHRVIEQVLGSLETFVERMEAGDEVERARVGRYADFFRGFADRCHHGKEEDRLFAAMVDHGFPQEGGPIAVMLEEHVEGRGHVRALAEVGSAAGPLEPEERLQVARHALAFIPLLRSHILKEDGILYPMAEQVIPASRLAELCDQFDAFERREVGEVALGELRALADSLVAAYPPDPVKMAAATACAGCAYHA